jgi:methylmalonyl-CoA mutase
MVALSHTFANMSAPDFKEFEPNGDYQTWKKLVMKELGDKPYETLIWQNENGFEIEPNYTEITHIADVKRPASWELCQEIGHPELKQLNHKLLQSLLGGSNAVGILHDLQSPEALDATLSDIEWPYISIHFRVCAHPLDFISSLLKYAHLRGLDTKTLRGSVAIDGLQMNDEALRVLSALWKENFSVFRIFEINAEEIHNKGGNTKQELAFALSAGNELIHRLVNTGVAVDDAVAMVQFRFATGNAYFPEIAKYRAFRLMWRTIVDQYKPTHACSRETFLYATTSGFLQTTMDMNNNLLRNVTQCMSAILGGANAVNVVSHEVAAVQVSDTSLRLARNIQQLLVEESHIDQVGDVASGAHYIEKLTEMITQVSWKLFQEIESKGGIGQYKNVLMDAVEANLKLQQSLISSGERVVVGINKYQPKSEKPARIAGHTLTGFLEKE